MKIWCDECTSAARCTHCSACKHEPHDQQCKQDWRNMILSY